MILAPRGGFDKLEIGLCGVIGPVLFEIREVAVVAPRAVQYSAPIHCFNLPAGVKPPLVRETVFKIIFKQHLAQLAFGDVSGNGRGGGGGLPRNDLIHAEVVYRQSDFVL